jgi:gliding motility-associated-like protein
MKFKTILPVFLFPFLLFGQDCQYFPLDTANVCGYEFTLDQALQEGTISYNCENEQYLSINYAILETNLAFSSCGIYELIYTATDGSCIDTLLIQVSDPNSSIITQNTDINLGYAAIDCPGNVTAGCYESAVSIIIGSEPPTPVWSFCSTTTCQTSFYTSDTLGNVTGCLADSIIIDTLSAFSSSNYCSDTMQNAFIVLNSAGDTVTDNTFLEYLSQLQDSSNVQCAFPGLECSFTNTSTCYDSIVMDTTILPIPVRLGGQWTMPMIDTLQLFDTTYFTYFGVDYELILNPGVDFYGPGELIVDLSEIIITNSNDTIREYPNDFYLSLQWEEEWIIDTLLLIEEKYFDTDDNCFVCGGFFSSGGFNVPGIPDFPCGPVGISYPSICECEYYEPDYSIQQIQCEPRMWQFELLNSDHFISYINGADANISQNIAILSNPNSQYVDIESVDYNGCSYNHNIYLEDYIVEFFILGAGDLSCETPSITLHIFAGLLFSTGDIDPYSIVWSNGQTGINITIYDEGTYTATFIDDQGCEHSSSVYVGYDHTIDCTDENPLANTECELSEGDIICDITTLESFNNVMPSQNSGGNQPFILCNGSGEPNNISWFSFVAYDGDYSLNIIPSGCAGSNLGAEGIQVGLYSDCTFSNSAFCDVACTENNVEVLSQVLVEGQVYHMFIDGCSGSVCNYSIEIQGNPEPPSLAPESITLSSNGEYIQNANTGVTQEYCVGTSILSQLTGVEIQGEYVWSVNTLDGEPYGGASSETTEYNGLYLTFDTEGTFEICVDEIRNGCDEFTWYGSMCFTVKTEKSDDEDFGNHYVCLDQESEFDISALSNLDPNEDGLLGIQGTFQSYQAGVNTLIAIDDNGCSYEQEFEIEYHPASEVPTIEIIECYSSLPIEIDGNYITEASFGGGNSFYLEDYPLLQESNQYGCDSIVHLSVNLLRFPENLLVPSFCTNEGITLNFEDHNNDASTDENFTIDIINPDGQFIAMNLSQNEFTIPHGSMDGEYTLLFTKTKNNTSCESSMEVMLMFSGLEPEIPEITNGPMSLCASEGSVTYVATNPDPNVDFSWSIDGDISDFSISGDHNQNISIDWKDSGGSLSVRAMNDCGFETSTTNEITIFASPELTLNNEDETCRNKESIITLDVDENLIDTYNWDFNGGTISSGSGLGPFTLIWDTEGTKQISLSTTDIFGCDQLLESEIMVNNTPVADFSVHADSICITDLLQITMNSEQSLIHNWNFDGGINMDTNDPAIMFDSPGWKTITLTTDNGICTSEEVSLSIYVESQMKEIEILCMDQSLHSLLFEWNDVEGADGYLITIDNQPAVTVTSNTFFADQLEENTSYDIEISVITNHRCPSPIAFSSCTTKECVSLEFTFDIPDIICIENNMDLVELISFVPDVDEGFSWAGENITGSVFDPNGLEEGVYPLQIQHQIDDCINSEIVEIRLVAPPEFDMAYDDELCFGTDFTSLELSVSEDSYTILIDGEISENESEISPGSHEIIVMNSNMCATYESIFIDQSEETILTILGDLEVKEGNDHSYSIDQTSMLDFDLNSIVWTINGTEYCAGADCISINPNLKTDSDIEIYALNNDGCEVSTKVRVLVDELEPMLVIPNIFSPNNDGVNDYWFVVPNKEDIKVESIKIIDRWNNIVYSQNDGSQNIEMKWDGKLNGSDLQPGVYVYTISYSANNNIETIYGDITIMK